MNSSRGKRIQEKRLQEDAKECYLGINCYTSERGYKGEDSLVQSKDWATTLDKANDADRTGCDIHVCGKVNNTVVEIL